jgi:MFS family permease
MTIFIPGVNVILLKWVKLPAHVADIWLARGSIIITTLSFFIMATAAHPALLVIGLLIFNLGSGYAAAMRSISIHVIGGQSSPDVGRLFAVVAIMEAFGAMIAGPLLAKIFQWGIDIGEPWIGIPYAFSGLIMAFVTVLTFFIVVEKKAGFVYTAVEEEEEVEGPISPIRPHHN